MVWQPEVEEIKRRKQLAEKGGDAQRIARHRSQGKLTVRERIGILADPGSFEEIGALGGSTRYEGNKLVSFTPKGAVTGICQVNGRKVVVTGGDATVGRREGESMGSSGPGGARIQDPQQLAMDWRLPFVRLIDSAGGSVATFEQIGRTYIPDGNVWSAVSARLLNTVPVVSAVMGSVAGLPAVDACLAHFNVMVKATSQAFPGGPPVVKAALGVDITKEELGGEQVLAYQSGTVDNVGATEKDALEMTRRFLSYMPDSVWDMPPRLETNDDPARREEELLSIVPRQKNRGYNAYRILKHVLDDDSFFEMTPHYGKSRITGFGRLNGFPVGVMINNPMFLGGSMDVAAGDKVYRFIQLLDTFHLPMVYFCDEPGFMVGLESQKQGILRAGARIVCTTCESKMPWITIITRQVFGVAGQLHGRPGGMYKRLAWPSGSWGSMHIEGGTFAAYRREIEGSPDPQAKLAEIEDRLKAIASPFRTAEAMGIEDLIDPRDTRPILCEFVEMAQRIIKTQLGPTAGPGYRP